MALRTALIVGFLIMASVRPAAAEPPPISDGHGWIVERDDGENITRCLHLPPREGGERVLGAVRFAPGVRSPVAQVAGWREELFLAFEPERVEDEQGRSVPIRRVVRIRAARSGVGTWVYPPGRPVTLPALPGEPELVGWTANDAGVFALMRPLRRGRILADEVREPGLGPLEDLELRALIEGSWAWLPLPWDVRGEDPGALRAGARRVHVRMYADRGGVNLVAFEKGASEARVWARSVSDLEFGYVGPPNPLAWQERRLPLTGANWNSARPARLNRVMFVPGSTPPEDALIAELSMRDAVGLAVLRPSGPALLARLEHVPLDCWIAAMAGGAGGAGAAGIGPSPRVVLAWREIGETPAESGGARSGPMHMVEVSTQTGRALYSGPAVNDGLISSQRYRVLAIALVAVMACVLGFVLKSEPAATPVLPAGIVPAGAMRRVVAAGIDFLIGSSAAAVGLGVPLSRVVDPAVLVLYDASVWPLAAAVGVSVAHCTVGEWLAGRSVGKALVGCTVVSVGGRAEPGLSRSPERAALWQALTRNVIRWVVPVVGLLVMLDPVGRHPGDIAARTMVVRVKEGGESDRA